MNPIYKRDEDGNFEYDAAGNLIVVKDGYNVNQGDTFECDKDLSKIYPEKIIRADTVEAVNEITGEGNNSDKDETRATYEAMTVDELKKVAAEYELEVKPNTKKADLIDMILKLEASM